MTRQRVRFTGLGFLTQCCVLKVLLTVPFQYPNIGLGEVVLKGVAVHSIVKKTVVLVGSRLLRAPSYKTTMVGTSHGAAAYMHLVPTCM